MSNPRYDNRVPPPDAYYPRSPEDYSAGAIFAVLAAAFLAIGIVVYSILNMNEPQRMTINPVPETTGLSDRVAPTPPAIQLPARPRTTPQDVPEEPRP